MSFNDIVFFFLRCSPFLLLLLLCMHSWMGMRVKQWEMKKKVRLNNRWTTEVQRWQGVASSFGEMRRVCVCMRRMICKTNAIDRLQRKYSCRFTSKRPTKTDYCVCVSINTTLFFSLFAWHFPLTVVSYKSGQWVRKIWTPRMYLSIVHCMHASIVHISHAYTIDSIPKQQRIITTQQRARREREREK